MYHEYATTMASVTTSPASSAVVGERRGHRRPFIARPTIAVGLPRPAERWQGTFCAGNEAWAQSFDKRLDEALAGRAKVDETAADVAVLKDRSDRTCAQTFALSGLISSAVSAVI